MLHQSLNQKQLHRFCSSLREWVNSKHLLRIWVHKFPWNELKNGLNGILKQPSPLNPSAW